MGDVIATATDGHGRRHRIFSNAAGNALRAFGRFPAALLLAGFNIFISAKLVWGAREDEETWGAAMLASVAGFLLSVLAGLFTERFNARRFFALAVQGGVAAAFLAMVWLFDGVIAAYEECFAYPYSLSLVAIGSLAAFELGARREDPSDVVPMLAFSSIVGGAAAFIVAAGFSMVTFAVENLFGADISSKIYEWFWCSAYVSVAPLFALAYGTRRERFEQPKVWRVMVVYVGLPLFLLLMAVLLAYAAKCAVTVSLPDGLVNALVIAASSIWLAIHFLVRGFEGGFLGAFTRFGGLLILPLVALQCAALWVRIAACGLTPARYLSCIFAAFVALFAVCTFVSRAFSRRAAFPVLAVFALFAAYSPWDVVNFTIDSQFAKLDEFRARRAAGEQFDDDARADISEVWRYTYRFEKGPFRYRVRKDRSFMWDAFRAEWGFDMVSNRNRGRAAGNESDPVHRRYDRDNKPFSLEGVASATLAQLNVTGGRIVVNSLPGVDLMGALKDDLEKNPPDGEFRVQLEDGREVVILSLSMWEWKKDAGNWSGNGTCLICTPLSRKEVKADE